MSKRSKRQADKRKKNRLAQAVASSAGSTVSSTERIDISISKLKAIIDRSEKEPLSDEDRQILLSVSETLHFVTEQLDKKSISLARLRNLLFGASTETLKNLAKQAPGQDDRDSDKNDKDSKPKKQEDEKTKPKGHGRNGADAYTGANKVEVPHETIKSGDPCLNCEKGTLYKMAKPKTLVRVTGNAPVNATVYEMERFRCNLCGKIFTAKAPDDIGDEKYDAESISMMATLKYGTGLPFNRLQGLQGNLGIPLPASTQWGIINRPRLIFSAAHEELTRIAAQGKVVHNDDTSMKITDLPPPDRPDDDKSVDKKGAKRTGTFTSGVVSVSDEYLIALFFTGHKHAGENLSSVLQHRADELDPPIQMCDALSRNIPKDLATLMSNCLIHGRRNFVEVFGLWPKEVLYVVELLAKVYDNDAHTRKEGLSDHQRLAYHQVHSRPLMDELKDWMNAQFEHKLVEPNSSLGGAITYMFNHWEKLTLFLREPGVPLDNNICERALKKAILHRKNSYFYKTKQGAQVGDMFMSLIHTCELNKVNAFDYLTQLQKNAAAVVLSPGNWMPWNYQQTTATIKADVKLSSAG